MTTRKAFLLLLLIVCGCQSPSTNMSKVQVGMSEAQVVHIVGKPVSRGVGKDGVLTLYYTFRENSLGSIVAPYSVRIVNNKVESFGRDGSPTASSAHPIIVPSH